MNKIYHKIFWKKIKIKNNIYKKSLVTRVLERHRNVNYFGFLSSAVQKAFGYDQDNLIKINKYIRSCRVFAKYGCSSWRFELFASFIWTAM